MVTLTLAYALKYVPEVKFKVIGEYSAVPVTSPTGKTYDPFVVKVLRNSPAPSATIILLAPNPVPATAEEPKVRLFEPRVKRPLVNVNIPFTDCDVPNWTPLALLILRLLNVVEELPPIVCKVVPLKLTVPLL